MITVRGRELVIPVAERQIGTQFDTNSETRQFKINRLTVGGIDISNLDFRIDLRYGKETKDTDVLEKEITDEHVILTWTVSAASVQQVGTVWIALRGSDDFGTVKWATNQGFLYVGKTINTPDGAQMALSELEKLEKRIDQKTESMDAAESSRVEAEKIRQENESARLKNEAEWQKQGEAAVEAAKTATAAQSAASASAEAAAGSAGTAGSAAQTATEAASAASASAEAAAGSAGTASSAAQTATTAQSAASTSAEAASGSAETASSAAQTATQKASEASSSASAAASDANVVKELIQGLGGFDGKASSVSAVDLLGLLGTENATSTVQALIDVIADKVLNQLLLRSNVVNNALTTEEGYALDARMGKSLQDQITAQNSNLAIVSSCINNVYIKKITNEGKYKQVFATSIIDSSHFCGLAIADGGLYSFHSIGNVTALVNRSTYKVVCSKVGNLARLSITGMEIWDECVVISNRDFKLTHE